MSKHFFLHNEFHWQGRHDAEDGAAGLRVHHVVQQIDYTHIGENPYGVALLGFACDAGVARNKGRIGAKKSPDLIRRALANLAWHSPHPLYDLGTVVCDDDLLESSQQHCAKIIAEVLPSVPVITLGGGHEVAWASFSGLARYFEQHHPEKAPKIGIINFDAHFDLRAFSSSQA
ncbi:formimidoylglutamase, partial [Vibrio vulnificus]